jgi:hypothetical protein
MLRGQGSEKKEDNAERGRTYEEAGLADCAVADDNQLH